ncbi:NADP-dependent oxidoreductase domain-containing protein [Pyrenochaeta sp. MPI-SDFR-AT-0127]|nr:NADP-dependent oxidoreductase domain-containing protein [Pyrenochaeta sp. MPI-SDFR-AT-0127]
MVKMLPFADIEVPVPGFGAMEAEPVLLKAIELGCTFWDTAVVYSAGINEKLLGDFIRKHNVRDKVFLASKCGFEVFNVGGRRITNSAEHINEYIEGTIERLGFKPDLYYLHRIDPNAPLEESITALDGLRKSSKTKYISLSEPSAATLRKANATAKIDAVQSEYSAFETLHETNGVIDACRELGVTFVAFSPLGYGVLVALAWVAAQGFISIPSTTKVHRLDENWASRDVELTDEEKAELRSLIDKTKPYGARFGK